MINDLKEKQIFVFGSNFAGQHLGGAAKQAKEQFGAEEGIGEGLTGQCYAFPTLDDQFCKVSDERLKREVFRLYNTCECNPDKEFLLTKVGCGIAGFEEGYIKSLFTNPPKNLVLPDDWILQD